MATNQSTSESPVAPAVVGPVAGTMRGIVQGWDPEDGYGFIRPPKEVRRDAPLLKRHQVEAAGLLDVLQDGMTLEFSMVESDVGPVAGNLRLVEVPASIARLRAYTKRPATEAGHSRELVGFVDGWDTENGYSWVVPDPKIREAVLLKRAQVEKAGLVDTLQDGMIVEFDMVDSDVGPVAGNLRLVTTQP